MIYSTTQYKNGKRWGRLEFNTGKIVILKPKELADFEAKIEYWQATDRLKERAKKDECMTCGLPLKNGICDHIHRNEPDAETN